MNVYTNDRLKVSDGSAEKGPNLVVWLRSDSRKTLFPRDVELLRGALSEWLIAVGREREAA